jgi:predicted RNase H-like HicB family nuclease
METVVPEKIQLTHEDDMWVAYDPESGIASQGETRQEALENLDEACALTRETKKQEKAAAPPDVPWFK